VTKLVDQTIIDKDGTTDSALAAADQLTAWTPVQTAFTGILADNAAVADAFNNYIADINTWTADLLILIDMITDPVNGALAGVDCRIIKVHYITTK
jgi:hypothetical protein